MLYLPHVKWRDTLSNDRGDEGAGFFASGYFAWGFWLLLSTRFIGLSPRVGIQCPCVPVGESPSPAKEFLCWQQAPLNNSGLGSGFFSSLVCHGAQKFYCSCSFLFKDHLDHSSSTNVVRQRPRNDEGVVGFNFFDRLGGLFDHFHNMTYQSRPVMSFLLVSRSSSIIQKMVQSIRGEMYGCL